MNWAADWVQVKLVLKEQLDRETQVQHRMTLIAVDGGPQAKTGTTSILFNVIDSNDNKPQFVGGPTFEVSVVENTPPGTVIIRLEAHDADEGLNGQVGYSFAPSTINSPAVKVFSIRNDTGELTVKVCLFIIGRQCLPGYWELIDGEKQNLTYFMDIKFLLDVCIVCIVCLLSFGCFLDY